MQYSIRRKYTYTYIYLHRIKYPQTFAQRTKFIDTFARRRYGQPDPNTSLSVAFTQRDSVVLNVML